LIPAFRFASGIALPVADKRKTSDLNIKASPAFASVLADERIAAHGQLGTFPSSMDFWALPDAGA